MSRGRFPRVIFWWIILVVALLDKVNEVKAHSCHEVKTAFQVRQIGPLKWVPETPGTDVDLLVCKHTGPSCCTRKMEESYRLAVLRETMQNIRSYSFELKYLISGHAADFQDTFQSLMSFSLDHLNSLFGSTYPALEQDVAPLVDQLFSQLSLYIQGANASVESAVHRFYDNLFPLVHSRLINPGMAGVADSRDECLRMTRQDVNPFGPHPKAMAREMTGTLKAGRALSRAMAMGVEVVNATETATLTRECVRALVKMQYCSHCRGLTLIKPCGGYCLNVMRGCLASLAELDMPWRKYVAVLEDLTQAVAGAHNLELALLGVKGQVNEAILHAQLHGPRLTATVDKLCGPSTADAHTTRTATTTGLPVTTVTTPSLTDTSAPPRANLSESPLLAQHGRLAHLRRSFPLKPSKSDKPRSLKKIAREFVGQILRYKSFYSALPEMLCEGEMVVDGFTCWSGDDVVESYTGRIVGNGVQAQRQNPEVRVRTPDPYLTNITEKLELFNQEMQESMPGLGHRESWVDAGSGVAEGSGECDDEDGCQGSGESNSLFQYSEFSTPEYYYSDRRVINGTSSETWESSVSSISSRQRAGGRDREDTDDSDGLTHIHH
ncbi:glypican-5 [Chanos chanos]|uniref:Glypican-5 n=1 Tax=Chanos chanos TaxID=29144 RepID=A0A6J2V8X9_CHACN|nr:glypican-5-like [Chanos chanos]